MATPTLPLRALAQARARAIRLALGNAGDADAEALGCGVGIALADAEASTAPLPGAGCASARTNDLQAAAPSAATAATSGTSARKRACNLTPPLRPLCTSVHGSPPNVQTASGGSLGASSPRRFHEASHAQRSIGAGCVKPGTALRAR